MKKTKMLITAAAFLFCMSACGSNQNSATTTDSSVNSNSGMSTDSGNSTGMGSGSTNGNSSKTGTDTMTTQPGLGSDTQRDSLQQ